MYKDSFVVIIVMYEITKKNFNFSKWKLRYLEAVAQRATVWEPPPSRPGCHQLLADGLTHK